ncbi:MAG TPA: cupin domain-containing protein [Candidatus Atribacteria bacterium]|nr:cupin domain-containing protein [Candidatus Atribacteria bacterium]
MKKANFFKVKELKAKKVLEDSNLRVVANTNTMVSFFEFGPNTTIMPEHKHPHEQTGVVIAGSVKMNIGGETKILKVGEGVVIPSNLEHEATPLEPGTKMIDFFYPIREDYLE